MRRHLPLAAAPRAFTLIELMVVIVIIVMLVGILLPALSSARNRGKKIAAQAQLTSVSVACESYASTFGSYPGYFADTTLGAGTNWMSFSSTENLVLSLLGGVVKGTAQEPITGPSWSGAVPNGYSLDKAAIGVGPLTTANKQYGAFYAPKPNELAAVSGTFAPDPNEFPELVDPATGVPILYLRAQRGPTQLVHDGTNAVFLRYPISDYAAVATLKTADGTIYDQRYKCLFSKSAAGDDATARNNLAWLVGNRKLSTYSTANDDLNDGDDVPIGGFALISPGVDGIYADKDQVGKSTINSFADVDKLDDIIVGGGSP